MATQLPCKSVRNLGALVAPESGRELMEGRYANYFKVGFNDQEVVIDFGQHHDGKEALMLSRIVICRAYLSTLVQMLEETQRGIDKDRGTRKR